MSQSKRPGVLILCPPEVLYVCPPHDPEWCNRRSPIHGHLICDGCDFDALVERLKTLQAVELMRPVTFTEGDTR